MFFGVCSLICKKIFVLRSFNEGIKGCIIFLELIKELLECFWEFIYKFEVIVDESILDDFYNFLVKYDIDMLVMI